MTPARLQRAIDVLLALIIGVFAAMYLASIGPYWNINPDSSTYVGWAKSLVEGTSFERGPVQPPMTSLLFAAVMKVFPDDYVALNALSVMLVLIAVGLVFILVRRRAGQTIALVVVMLSLASVVLHHESTQLLSEPAYMVASMATLVVLDRMPSNGQATLRLSILLGGGVVATVLTRTVGLALPLAILLGEFGRRVTGSGRLRLPLVVTSLTALPAVVLWELFGARSSYAASWFRMFFVEDVWSADTQRISLTNLLARLEENTEAFGSVPRILMNLLSPDAAGLSVAIKVLLLLLFVGGLIKWLRRIDPSAIYVAVYVGIVTAHSLMDGTDHRFFVPVMPLLLFYAVDAVRGGVASLDVTTPRPALGRLVTAAVCLVTVPYLVRGFEVVSGGRAEAHSSPFGAYRIKRSVNYDLQRVALWVRDNTPRQAVFASWQRDMIEVISERRGVPLSPRDADLPDALLGKLRNEGVSFLVVDRKRRNRGEDLLKAVQARPDIYRPELVLEGAALFAVLPIQKALFGPV